MKTCILFLSAVLFSTAVAQQTTPVLTVRTRAETTATITLGPLLVTIAPLPPRPPFTFVEGTHLKFTLPKTEANAPVVSWYKDGTLLPFAGEVLEIPSASAADSGTYSATVRIPGQQWSWFTSDIASVLITRPGQRLLNVSSRARINSSQPSVLSGFVIESGPSQVMVLVRAVGPALAQLGVNDPLAAPTLRLIDSTGRALTPLRPTPLEGIILYPLTPAEAAVRVGAFPLPNDGRDVAHLYLVSKGAYTAEVASEGGSGTVLLEVYEVPF